jgi:hypothetical protein
MRISFSFGTGRDVLAALTGLIAGGCASAVAKAETAIAVVASIRAAAVATPVATAIGGLAGVVLRVWPAQSIGPRSIGFTTADRLLLLTWCRRT